MIRTADMARVLDSATGVIEDQRTLVVALTEQFGGLIALLEHLLPRAGVKMDDEIVGRIAEARRWLLDIKRVDVRLDELLRLIDEIRRDVR